jgi:acetoin utilization deacetylase AcuC-like enzyme
MILYEEKHNIGLIDFGIEIPVVSSRSMKTFEFLKSHEILGSKIDQWHMAKIEEQISKNDLLRVHSAEYANKLFSAGLEQEIINTFELVDDLGNYYRYNPANATVPLVRLFDRILKVVAGTTTCCRLALEKKFCFALSGGMHHAQYGFGKGFCMLNDIVIAIRKLQAENRINTVWVIDVDAHKGDGTAALTRGDDTITTLSIHMGQGWPLDEKKYDHAGNLNPSFIDSDIDIPMARGEDHLYLARLQEGLNELENFPKPELAVVVAGVDPFEKDELPSTSDLKLTIDQLNDRDRMVYRFLRERGIPAAFLMAGGYGEHSWKVYAQFLEWALLDVLETNAG